MYESNSLNSELLEVSDYEEFFGSILDQDPEELKFGLKKQNVEIFDLKLKMLQNSQNVDDKVAFLYKNDNYE